MTFKYHHPFNNKTHLCHVTYCDDIFDNITMNTSVKVAEHMQAHEYLSVISDTRQARNAQTSVKHLQRINKQLT